MKAINLLLAMAFVLFATTVNAATFASEGSESKGLKTHYISITNLDTGTNQLTVDACSAIQIVADPSVAATVTIVAQMDSVGTVSHTVVNSSGDLAVSGTTVDIPAGAVKIQADIGVTVSPATVNLAVIERPFQNCRLRPAQ